MKFAGRLFALAAFLTCSIARGSPGEDLNSQSSCHRRVLLDFFDDLQDCVNTKDAGDLVNFMRHFCKAKYTEKPPCEVDEGVEEQQPLSSREFKHLYTAMRQFVCDGELHTWQGIKRMFAGENRSDCWRTLAAVKKWPLPRAELCNEIEKGATTCSTHDVTEKKVLTLAASAARVFDCAMRAGEPTEYLQAAHENSSKRHRSACKYRKAVNCLTDFMLIYTSKVITVAKKKQELKQKIVDDICQRPKGNCAKTHSTEDCNPDQKNVVTRFEDAISASIAVICREDAAFLMNMSRTLHCVEVLKLNDCINPNGILSPVAIFGTSHTPEQCRTIEKKAIRCSDNALLRPDECGEHPDIEGARDVLHVFLARADCSRQSRSGAVQPQPVSHASAVFALGAIVVAAVPMRRI